MLLEPRFFGANASDDNRLAYQAFWFPGGVIFDRRQEVRTRIKPVAAEVYPHLRAHHYLRDREGRIRTFRYFLRRNVLITPGIYCLRKGSETYEEYILRHETDWTPEELKEAV